MKTADGDSTHGRIHKVVSRIPRGRVATYGQIARLAGLARQARLVGYAMHALPAGTRLPWQRVVNAQGAISLPGSVKAYASTPAVASISIAFSGSRGRARKPRNET